MTTKDFEDGRKLQKLETQIGALYEEIHLRSGKNNPAQKIRLRVHLDEAFKSYLDRALQYHIESAEVQNTSVTFLRGMDDNYKPFSL